MLHGTLISIHIAPDAKAPTVWLEQVRAVPGAGLEGDRYYRRQGTFYKPEPDFELTLIESEALEALARDYHVRLEAGESRRNLVTRDVPLNHLIDREFSIGEVRVRGIRLCEPCNHLQAVCGKTVIPGLRHRGGLRAQIVSEGLIRAGDPIRA